MKPLIPVLLVLTAFLFRCSPSDSQSNKTADEASADAANTQTTKEENLADDGSAEEYELDNIGSLIALFKEGNVDKIAASISYPLSREHPIPAIQNEGELKQRFSEVFDATLIDKIATSTAEQWSEVGSKGMMLDNGEVWIDSDSGKIIAVNYQSEIEKQLKDDFIAQGKEHLHASLRNFEKPTYKIKTEDYLIRIDELSNHKYRYASWKISADESTKPDLVLNNGELEYDGSGGNHVITFVNNNYTYKIHRNVLGADDTPEAVLEIEKDGQVILAQDGSLD